MNKNYLLALAFTLLAGCGSSKGIPHLTFGYDTSCFGAPEASL